MRAAWTGMCIPKGAGSNVHNIGSVHLGRVCPDATHATILLNDPTTTRIYMEDYYTVFKRFPVKTIIAVEWAY